MGMREENRFGVEVIIHSINIYWTSTIVPSTVLDFGKTTTNETSANLVFMDLTF